MTEQHSSALELIKALRALDATEATVGDVSVRFANSLPTPIDAVSLQPVPVEVAAELDALREFKRSVEEAGY